MTATKKAPAPKPIKISIIIATYNAADVLPGCLDSIKAQTHPHLEVIVADGASTDGTLDILGEYEGKLNLRWMSEPDKSFADAWNKGLPKASGDWILFLGADDRLHHPESLARAAERLADVPAGTLLAYGQARVASPSGEGRLIGQPWNEIRHKLVPALPIHHQACFHSSALFESVGKFDPDPVYTSDFKLVLQSLPHADPVFLGNIVIATFSPIGQSYLRVNRLAVRLEVRGYLKELGYPTNWSERWATTKAAVWFVLSRLAGEKPRKERGRNRLRHSRGFSDSL